MRTGTATQVTDANRTHPAEHAEPVTPAHETDPADHAEPVTPAHATDPAPAPPRQSTQRAPHPS
ncbi:hypothetical protein ABZ733_10545 [Streptomyces longwoodensis]|uniref:hypothetical protein n=1 Tax=Streptomyces longwoodensis TaxID=68231 RepID=UPI003407417D